MKLLTLFVCVFVVALSGSVSTSGIVIDCFFDLELLFDELKASYTCTVLNEHVTNATTRDITQVQGPHSDKNTNDDITQIHIIKRHMEYFPHGFSKFFKNIVAIHAGLNRLKYLVRNDLKEFSKLRYLYLYSNMLETLQSDVFLSNTALEYVSFYNNRLMHIGSKILSPLKQLRKAYFDKNICIDKQAASEQGISELKLEIAQQCSNITDEDLFNMLRFNNIIVTKLEAKVAQISEQLTNVIEMLTLTKGENKTL